MDARFQDFLPHIEHYLGDAREFEEPTVTGRNRGYGLFFCYGNDDQLISIVSNGLRFQNITAVLPQEILCTVWAAQRKAAHLLVPLTAELILRRGSGLMLDEVVPSPEPLIPGTAIQGVVAAGHPYIEDDDFNSLADSTGQVELQLITLIPMTAAEIQFAEHRGVDELYAIWEERETDLLDTARQSAV